ncbi:MAG: radical SAM protein, partial [Bacteroidales bacterium]|nr:radical SAM protein [Bacteroidales bacterium]
MNINLITLGCSKNLVDSGKLLYQLKLNGHEVIHNSESLTSGLIINTCGFILDAKTESIETILEYSRAKKAGYIEKLVVMGCLSERYKESLKKEIPEVDAFFGVNETSAIVNFFNGQYYADQIIRRIGTTPSHYAYLKISEGCNRNCAFCAIPAIRGKQVSIPVEQLVEEAVFLAGQGVRELILIAQELTSYGTDIYKRKALPELIKELVKINDFQWIRLHYAYPDSYPVDEIVSLMHANPQICRYLDIP